MTASLPVEIAETVADSEDVGPEELESSLHDHIDVDALEQLARHEGSWTLSFEFPPHEVTVTSDGEIIVDEVREDLRA